MPHRSGTGTPTAPANRPERPEACADLHLRGGGDRESGGHAVQVCHAGSAANWCASGTTLPSAPDSGTLETDYTYNGSRRREHKNPRR
jgi:hypothetical protein